MPSYWLLTNHAILFVFFALFITCFVHNVASNELLDISTAVSYLKLYEEFFFTELDGRDIIQTPQIPVIR
jgi:hypothetical protein